MEILKSACNSGLIVLEVPTRSITRSSPGELLKCVDSLAVVAQSCPVTSVDDVVGYGILNLDCSQFVDMWK